MDDKKSQGTPMAEDPQEKKTNTAPKHVTKPWGMQAAAELARDSLIKSPPPYREGKPREEDIPVDLSTIYPDDDMVMAVAGKVKEAQADTPKDDLEPGPAEALGQEDIVGEERIEDRSEALSSAPTALLPTIPKEDSSFAKESRPDTTTDKTRQRSITWLVYAVAGFAAIGLIGLALLFFLNGHGRESSSAVVARTVKVPVTAGTSSMRAMAENTLPSEPSKPEVTLEAEVSKGADKELSDRSDEDLRPQALETEPQVKPVEASPPAGEDEKVEVKKSSPDEERGETEDNGEDELNEDSTLVTLRIGGVPRGATVLIDGRPAKRPYRVTKSDRAVKIEVMASGFVTATKRVVPLKDKVVSVRMKREK